MTEVSIVTCNERALSASHPLVGRVNRQGIPQLRMPALRTGPIVPTFRPPSWELYERSEASPEGSLDSFATATSYSEESSIVRTTIQPSPTPDEQELGATTSKVPGWQLYKE